MVVMVIVPMTVVMAVVMVGVMAVMVVAVRGRRAVIIPAAVIPHRMGRGWRDG